jgi:hypothetical protein
MSCVLRAAGENFDVEAFLVQCQAAPLSTWKKGEKRSQGASANKTSGVRFQVSDAEFSDLSAQANDALAFLQVHREWLARLVAFPGVEQVVADFGTESKPPYWASFVFEPSLLVALGKAGIALELSVYPSSESEAGHA